ncbi:MAG: DUF2283 domain-containing protein [Proteobacteria bacterium]|nr:DUF2283 domain-containing protein [Pseudomonadota bacterium]
MRMSYDSQTDILRILLIDSPVGESDEVLPGIIIDYDQERNAVGFELLEFKDKYGQGKLPPLIVENLKVEYA